MARLVHVHRTEVSTDADAMGSYTRGMIVALALATIACSMWLAMRPAETAAIAGSAALASALAPEEQAASAVDPTGPALPTPLWLR